MSAPRPRAFVDRIAAYVPGEAKIAGQAEPLRLAANESAWGPSPAARAAAGEQDFARYPDPDSGALRAAIAERYALPVDRIVCGAGSDEIITLLCRAYAGPGDEVLHSAHGFLMYPIAAVGVGATPVAAPERDLRADVDALLDRAGPQTALCFIANPNNPTGSFLTTAEIARLRARLPERCLLVIDAAYAEYATDPDYEEGLGLAAEREDVFVTHTFSKIHALAALRIGWGFGPARAIQALNKLRGPFNLAAPAQSAAAAAILDTPHTEHVRDATIAARDHTAARLTALGLSVAPSAANFLLVRCDDVTAAYAHLLGDGILVRRMASYGLPDHLRIGIAPIPDMDRLCDSLGRFMHG